jgi:hypothetical protein
MVAIGETLGLFGFPGSGRTFETNAFNYSAISQDKKPA